MSEQAQSPDTGKFQAVGYVLVGGLGALLVAALSIGGLAWLMGLTGMGLSADARFIMATIIVCSSVVSLTIVVVGAIIAMSHARVSSSMYQPPLEDAAYDEEEYDEEDEEEPCRKEYFKYLMATSVGRVIDGFPEVVAVPDDLSTKHRYRRAKSTKSNQRRRTNRK